jgi:hypothetical protein
VSLSPLAGDRFEFVGVDVVDGDVDGAIDGRRPVDVDTVGPTAEETTDD